MWHEVYISYAPADRRVAEAVCKTLESRGFRCWIAPRDMLPGIDRGEALLEALGTSRLMILIFSSHLNQAPETTRDVQRAAQRHIPVLSFRIEPVMPSNTLEVYPMAAWIEAYTGSPQKHLETLRARLQPCLDREPISRNHKKDEFRP